MTLYQCTVCKNVVAAHAGQRPYCPDVSAHKPLRPIIGILAIVDREPTEREVELGQ